MITLTDACKAQIADIISDKPEGTVLRVFVAGGGCAGFSYGFALANKNELDEDDMIVDELCVTDAMSNQYLEGATIHWNETLMGSSFTIDNPHAQTQCGCGSSFSVR